MQKMIYMSNVTEKEFNELQKLTKRTGSAIIRELIAKERQELSLIEEV